ncbi:MAG: bifunctional 4-hydroxy-2-oxoglutarate aldolase/2-dehydro-3-deoxy-phosphogluconate aldolase [Syntrophobacteraceae bacterium]
MEKIEVLDLILLTGLVPVVRVPSPEAALRVADALRDGGVSIIEITMTVPGALKVVEELGRRYGNEVVIGAGTVLDPATGKAALLAGAQFLVSPVLDVELVRYGRRHGVLVIPGALTPTEILAGWNSGAVLVKVFPAGPLGGADYIRSIRGPLPHINLIPTGGVNLGNAGDFIRAGAAAVGVGGELLDKTAIARGEFSVIRDNAAAFLEAVRKAKGIET